MTLNGTAAADTIDLSNITVDTANDPVLTIDAGVGADTVTASAAVDTIAITDGDSGAYNTTSAKVASTANMDVINDLAAGDKIDLTAAVSTEANYDAFTTATAGADLTATVLSTTIGQFIGTYDADDNTFTSDTSGDDLMLLFVNDDGTTADEGIILVGQTDVMADGEITDGIITIA